MKQEEESAICECGCWEGNHDEKGCYYGRSENQINLHNCKKFKARIPQK